jgi:hypothetical protein
LEEAPAVPQSSSSSSSNPRLQLQGEARAGLKAARMSIHRSSSSRISIHPEQEQHVILPGEQGAALACTSSRSSGSRGHNRRLLHRRYRKSVMWPKSLLGPISRSRIHLRQRHPLPPPIWPHSLIQFCSSDTNHLHFRPSNLSLTLHRMTPPPRALPPPPFSGEGGYGDVGNVSRVFKAGAPHVTRLTSLRSRAIAGALQGRGGSIGRGRGGSARGGGPASSQPPQGDS